MADPKQLVFDEARHTQWARVELAGDAAAARQHIPAARAVLGEMLAFHGVNARRAQGEGGGFFHRQMQLPDGTRIHAITNDGHHTLRIHAPPAAGARAAVKRVRRERLEAVRVAGHCSDPDSGFQYAVLWDSPGALTVREDRDERLPPSAPPSPLFTAPRMLGLVGACDSYEANAISADGSTVVGTAKAGLFGANVAWRWVDGQGMQDLGRLPWQSRVSFYESLQMTAVAVNEDGTIVAGHGPAPGDAATPCIWLWTRDGGFALLPDALGATVQALSPNGLWLAGTVPATPTAPGLRDATNGAVWQRADVAGSWTRQLIPRPGTTSQYDWDYDANAPLTTPDASSPRHVDDNGLATGIVDHTAMTAYTVHNHYRDGISDGHGGLLFDTTTTFRQLQTIPYPFTFDAAAGAYTSLQGASVGQTSGAADDPLAIVGTEAHQTPGYFRSLTDASGNWLEEFDVYISTTDKGWYWDRDQGRIDLGDNTLANAITGKAQLVAGARGADAQSQLPTYWLTTDFATNDLPLLPGTVSGAATCATDVDDAPDLLDDEQRVIDNA